LLIHLIGRMVLTMIEVLELLSIFILKYSAFDLHFTELLFEKKQHNFKIKTIMNIVGIEPWIILGRTF
jgi:hypothetical protein